MVLELGNVNLMDIFMDVEDVQKPKRRGRKPKKVVEEPTEAEMQEIASSVEQDLKAWNIYVCSSCNKKADLLLSKFDGEGNVICPHCKNSN